MRMVIAGLEGCISDSRHRGLWCPDNAHVWNLGFANDDLNKEVADILNCSPYNYVIITSKDFTYEKMVIDWLKKQEIHPPLDIYFRQLGDHRHSSQVKADLLKRVLRNPHDDIAYAIDSHESNCAMYRRFKIPTFHYKNTP